MMPRSFYLTLTPWLAFVVSDRSAGLGPSGSAAVAAGIALAIFANDTRLHRGGLLPRVATALFTSLLVASAALGEDQWMQRFDRAIAVAVLATCLTGSLARERLAHSGTQEEPTGLSTANAHRDRYLKTMGRWSLAMGLTAVSYGIDGALARAPATDTVFDWLLPIILVVAAVNWSPKAPPTTVGDEVAPALDLLEGFVSHPALPHLTKMAAAKPVLPERRSAR